MQKFDNTFDLDTLVREITKRNAKEAARAAVIESSHNAGNALVSTFRQQQAA